MEFLEINNNNKAFLYLPKMVDHNTVYGINIYNIKVEHLIIDFQKTTKVTLSGILYLICLSGYLYENAKVNLNLNSTFYCEIINLKEYLLKYIMNFGFFQQMSDKGNLIRVNNIYLMIDKGLIETEKRFIKYQFEKNNFTENDKNLIMPASTIVMGEKTYFESYVRNFRNQFSDYYKKLVDLDFIQMNNGTDGVINENFQDFLKTIFEIIKNIYDHSKSWGIGAIHANDRGMEIAYYDIGIGVINSMRCCEKYSTKSSIELIKLSLKDGVSSKLENGDNKGRGFTEMQKFIEKRNGLLSIRTDKYHIVNNKEKEVKWFPGTQIVIYIPKL